MDYFNIILPYDYVSRKIKLTWQDIKYAIEKNYLSPIAAIEHAVAELSEKEEYSQEIMELACLRPEEPIKPYLEKLVNIDVSYDEEIILDKWLYLILDWLFNNKDKYADPLEIVEQVYADFDYPQQISNFVRYMPSNEPDFGSLELNKKHMYNKWKEYLTEQEKRFSK